MALCAEELSLRATVKTFRKKYDLKEFGPHTETYEARVPQVGMS